MRTVDVLHILAIASRSGRAVATLAEFDLETVDPSTAAHEAAARAHSPLNDPQRHADLRDGLIAAHGICEDIPGNVATAHAELPDGRSAIIMRHIEGDGNDLLSPS